MPGQCWIPELLVFKCESTSERPLREGLPWVAVFLHLINDLCSNFDLL